MSLDALLIVEPSIGMLGKCKKDCISAFEFNDAKICVEC